MRKFALISTLAVLAACSQSGDEATPAPEATAEDLASHVGAAIVTDADGASYLSVSTADGKTYSADLPKDFKTGTWAVEGDKACVTPPEGDKFCITYGPANEDGTVPVSGADGALLGTMVSLDGPIAAGTTPPYGASNALGTPADGEPFLSVWTADGTAYRGDNPGEGTWRAENGKRCGKGPGATEETCSTPGTMGPDNTFEATSDSGEKVTVRFLS